MLDDSNVIAQHDPQDALGFITKQPEQLKYDFGLAETVTFGPVKNVICAGMGGSALVAELAKTWPPLMVPFLVVKDYSLPPFVTGSETLVIASSYSGNTEETLAALECAQREGAQIAVITHGGTLKDIADEYSYPLAELPECPQPRTGIFYAYRALVEIFVAACLMPKTVIPELEAMAEPLQQVTNLWTADIPTNHNPAKQLAKKMAGKTPIIYAGPLMYPAAYKWKISVNENAKNTAWCNFLPEFNHNEFIGWSSHPVEKPFAVINLLSSFEYPRMQKRFEVSDRLLSGMRPASINIEAKGQNALEHMLYLILLGDYATTYLAFLNGVNPTPVDLVEKFKKELG